MSELPALGEAPSIWPWLRAHVHDGAPGSARIGDDGNLTVRFGAGHELLFAFFFQPCPWGERTVQVGTHLVVDPAHRRAVVELAAGQLGVPPPLLDVEAEPGPFLVATHLTSVPNGFTCDTQLVELVSPRALLWLHVVCRWDGEARLTFRGPRGRKSRMEVLASLERHLTAATPER